VKNITSSTPVCRSMRKPSSLFELSSQPKLISFLLIASAAKFEGAVGIMAPLTVKPFVNVAVPPPGAALVAETFRAPNAALAPIMMLAVICVALLTVVELTVMSAPKLTELTPLIKFVPVKITLSDCKRLPLFGEILDKVGAGFAPTVKPFVNVAVPPPGPALVTETFRAPCAAFAPIVMLAVICVALLTVVELTVMSAPKLTELTPPIKFVPVKTTFSVCKRLPLFGEILDKVGAGFAPTVKPLVNVAVPPPGVELVTETLRAPNAALAPIVMLAVICVALLTVVEFIVMSAPKLTELMPLIKFVPVKITLSDCKRLPLVGEIFVNVGGGFAPTVKPLVNVAVPPPGVELVTETLRAPNAALAPIVMLAVICVALLTVVKLTVMSAPKLTELTPLIKFVPVKITFNVCKRLPLFGEILDKVGVGFAPTVKPFVNVVVPPPGPALVTETFRAPSAAFAPIVMLAVICVALLTVVELTVMSAPKLTELTPPIKFVPVKTTFSDCKRLPLVGEMLVNVGGGFAPTVKPLVNVAVPPPGVKLVTETLRAPNAALAPIVMLAVICVALLTVVELTVMSAPKLTELMPLIKFVPVKITFNVCKRLPLFGEILDKVGAGLFTVKV